MMFVLYTCGTSSGVRFLSVPVCVLLFMDPLSVYSPSNLFPCIHCNIWGRAGQGGSVYGCEKLSVYPTDIRSRDTLL